jgi:23S rRNA pseudouridine2605 synthase
MSENPPAAPPNPTRQGQRIAKAIARAGLCSRRDAEEWILAGRVSVNGKVLESPAFNVGAKDEIRVDGERLKEPERTRLFLFHKPRGLVTTARDPEGRPTIFGALPDDLPRVVAVGRLDINTEGLLLLTNDGGLMQQLTNAASNVAKTYMVKISGVPTEEQIDRLRSGIYLPSERSRAGTMGGTRPGMARRSNAVRTQPAKIELVREQENPWYRVTLT